MNLKKIKCIMLDFDSTLYSGANFDNADKFYMGLIEKAGVYDGHITNIDDLKILYPTLPHRLARTIKYLRDNYGSAEKFFEVLNKNVYKLDKKAMISINAQVINDVCKKYPVYIVSDSAKIHLIEYLKFMKINPDIFCKLESNKFLDEDMTKYPMMKQILEENNFKKDELIMIGDSEKSDIIPAKKLGCQTYLTKNVYDTEKILTKLINLKEQQ